MLSGYIATLSDNQLTGSTTWRDDHGYQVSRLHTVSVGLSSGGWVSGSSSIGQFIQADLGTVRRVEMIATQGRQNFDHWVTSYRFSYSVDGVTYTFIVECDGSERVLTGNTDRDTVVENELETAVAARFVRIHPQTYHGTPSLRWEVYGCDIGKKCYHVLCANNALVDV